MTNAAGIDANLVEFYVNRAFHKKKTAFHINCTGGNPEFRNFIAPSMYKRRILLHLIFWGLYLGSQSLIWMNAFESETALIEPGTGREIITRITFPGTFWLALRWELTGMPGKVFAVYANLYWLLPRFLLRKNWFRFAFSLIGILLVATFLEGALRGFLPVLLTFQGIENPSPFFSPGRFVQALAITANVVAFTGAIKILLHYFEEKRRTEQLLRERLAAELQYLKAQINPHFFFNTLNNLYGMALDKSEKTPAMLLRLSNIMSYVLYEANAPDVPLQKEVDILEGFIALEKLRHGDRASVAFSVRGSISGARLPPLLLLPFVENAFKHSTKGNEEHCWINIQLEVTQERLIFKVENNAGDSDTTNTSNSGIGLENVRRRLELLYPKKHVLKITRLPERFFIHLSMDIIQA